MLSCDILLVVSVMVIHRIHGSSTVTTSDLTSNLSPGMLAPARLVGGRIVRYHECLRQDTDNYITFGCGYSTGLYVPTVINSALIGWSSVHDSASNGSFCPVTDAECTRSQLDDTLRCDFVTGSCNYNYNRIPLESPACLEPANFVEIEIECPLEEPRSICDWKGSTMEDNLIFGMLSSNTRSRKCRCVLTPNSNTVMETHINLTLVTTGRFGSSPDVCQEKLFVSYNQSLLYDTCFVETLLRRVSLVENLVLEPEKQLILGVDRITVYSDIQTKMMFTFRASQSVDIHCCDELLGNCPPLDLPQIHTTSVSTSADHTSAQAASETHTTEPPSPSRDTQPTTDTSQPSTITSTSTPPHDPKFSTHDIGYTTEGTFLTSEDTKDQSTTGVTTEEPCVGSRGDGDSRLVGASAGLGMIALLASVTVVMLVILLIRRARKVNQLKEELDAQMGHTPGDSIPSDLDNYDVRGAHAELYEITVSEPNGSNHAQNERTDLPMNGMKSNSHQYPAVEHAWGDDFPNRSRIPPRTQSYLNSLANNEFIFKSPDYVVSENHISTPGVSVERPKSHQSGGIATSTNRAHIPGGQQRSITPNQVFNPDDSNQPLFLQKDGSLPEIPGILNSKARAWRGAKITLPDITNRIRSSGIRRHYFNRKMDRRTHRKKRDEVSTPF